MSPVWLAEGTSVWGAQMLAFLLFVQMISIKGLDLAG
jgi:hypothetical protein